MSRAGLSHEMRGIPAVARWIKQFQAHWHETENTTYSENFTDWSIVFSHRVVSELPSNPKPLAYRRLMWRFQRVLHRGMNCKGVVVDSVQFFLFCYTDLTSLDFL